VTLSKPFGRLKSLTLPIRRLALGLNDYTLEEFAEMLAYAEDIGLDDHAVYDTLQAHYDARHAAKILFLDLFDGVE
jgi:hypothetical protein